MRWHSHRRGSILTDEAAFSQTRRHSHRRGGILTDEASFSQTRQRSHRGGGVLTDEAAFSQTRRHSQIDTPSLAPISHRTIVCYCHPRGVADTAGLAVSMTRENQMPLSASVPCHTCTQRPLCRQYDPHAVMECGVCVCVGDAGLTNIASTLTHYPCPCATEPPLNRRPSH